MNRKAIKLFSIIMLTIMLMTIGTISKAAIEVKKGTTPYTNIKVSDSYNLCYNLRNSDSTLGNNSLDPHLVTNADWGAAAYLGISAYGSVRSANGTSVTIDGKSYNSTTKNITGVINMGKTYTQTSSLITGYTSNDNITTLKNNLSTKYVETLGATAADATNNGRAFEETKGWYSSNAYYPTTSYPVGIRAGVLGFDGNYSGSGYGSRCCEWCHIPPSTLELELRSSTDI